MLVMTVHTMQHKLVKTAYIMMMKVMKCLFFSYNTYNTFGSTNDTPIKCKSSV